MDEKDLGELRELVEFLKQNGIAQFEMERADLKVKLKFAGADTAASAGGVDLAQLAQWINAAGGAGAAGAGTAGAGAATSGTVAPVAGVQVAGMVQAAAEPSAPEAAAHVVKSPLVGTFYGSPSPGAEPFVKIGDRVAVGQVLCIVEAMKLMNEVEADAAGEIVKVFPEAGQPVEYGQALFAIQ